MFKRRKMVYQFVRKENRLFVLLNGGINCILEVKHPKFKENLAAVREEIKLYKGTVHYGGSITYECKDCGSRLIKINQCLTCDSIHIKTIGGTPNGESVVL